MSLRKGLRALYEAHLREIRDRNARDAFVREEGKAEGKADSVLQLLNIRGVVSKELEQVIRAQRDLEILNSWHLMAARAESVDDFVEEAGLRRKFN